jgi:NADPH:quinone reductase-like Zn-dependent oxidoreductase
VALATYITPQMREAAHMKAIATTTYGGPEVLSLTDLPDPKLGPDSVLVRTRDAGVNPVDWKILAGGLARSKDGHTRGKLVSEVSA